MNLTTLDGINDPSMGRTRRRKSKRRRRRAKPQIRREAVLKSAPMRREKKSRKPTKKMARRVAKEYSPKLTKASSKRSSITMKPKSQPMQMKTKRGKRLARAQKYSSINGGQDGSDPIIGFSRIYEDNEPEVNLQGYGRITYSNKELQGLSMDGYTILQGYGMGDSDDLEDWNYLLSINHPDTMQGFPTWVLNGKKERKARQAKRKAQREARRKGRGEKKGKKQERRQRRKEVRVAKKEERLTKKQQKRESRTERKAERRARQQQRLDDRKERQRLRQETRRLKAELRAETRRERGGMLPEIFDRAGEFGLPFVQDLISGGGDFDEFSVDDFTFDEFPTGFRDVIDVQRGRTSEEALASRDEDLEILDDEPEGERSMMIPLVLGGGILIAMTMGKKKKKK